MNDLENIFPNIYIYIYNHSVINVYKTVKKWVYTTLYKMGSRAYIYKT